MNPSVLIIGNYCQTLTAIRSLARAGYHVIAERDDKRTFTQYSRYTSEVWRHPDIEKSEDEFVAALQQFLAARKDVTLVLPVGETEIRCLMRNAHAIPSSVAVVMPDSPAITACFDKARMYEVAGELGIPHAALQRVSNYPQLQSAIRQLGYPCVIKPNTSLTPFFGVKAMILQTAADLQKMLPTWPAENQFLILQKFARGHRHNCHFVADRGRLLAYFEQRVLRTDTQDGTGYGVHGMSYAPTPKLREYCSMLAQQLNYSGVGCAQFLVEDAGGTVSFLEVNPRLDATCAVPFHCGYDFPRMAVAYAEYRRGALSQPPTNTSPYPAGRQGVSLWRDILGWRSASKRKELDAKSSRAWLKNMLLTFFRGDFHLTWSWKDPLPTCYRYVHLGWAFVAALFVGLVTDDAS